MPLYKDISLDGIRILFWKLSDTDRFDLQELVPSVDLDKWQNFSPKRRSEYLMIRQMLKMFYPEYQILYREDGTPYLVPGDWEISISHSLPFAVLALSKSGVGVDIECFRYKIQRIKHKFLSLNERSWLLNQENEIERLNMVWSIKEALYKRHPVKYWSFSKHYEVQSFSIEESSVVKCRVYDGEKEQYYTAKVYCSEDFCWAVVN